MSLGRFALLGCLGALLLAGGWLAWEAAGPPAAAPRDDASPQARLADRARALAAAPGGAGLAAGLLREELAPWLRAQAAPAEAWRALLASEDSVLRWGALLAWEGPRPRGPETLALLRGLCEDADPRVADAARTRLAGVSAWTPEGVARALAALRQESSERPAADPSTRGALLRGLSRSGVAADRLLRPALAALASPEAALRAAGAFALSRMALAELRWEADLLPREALARRLGALAGDPAASGRAYAVIALGRLGEHAASQAALLVDLLDEGEAAWRGQVALALIHLGPPAHPVVAETLRAGRGDARNAARLLWVLRRGHATARLRALVEQAPPEIGVRAADALGLLEEDADAHTAGLADWLTHENPRVLRLALERIARIGPPASAARPQVAALRAHPVEAVAEAAARTLAALQAGEDA